MKPHDDMLRQLDVPAERPLDPERKAALKDEVLQSIGGADPSADYRSGSLRRRVLIPVLAAVLLGAFLGSLTTAYALSDPSAPSASPESLTTISTEGSPVGLTGPSRALPDHDRSFLMAMRGSTAYLRLSREGGEPCFFTGRRKAERAAFQLGGGSCWTPSPRFPILDLSPIQASGPGGFQVLRVQGFAADGVATIALRDLDGRTIAETAVRDNVYKVTAYPPAGASTVTALDAGGHVLQQIRYSP